MSTIPKDLSDKIAADIRKARIKLLGKHFTDQLVVDIGITFARFDENFDVADFYDKCDWV